MTATYETGEAFLAAKAATVTGFTTANVKRSDWTVLSSGASDHYAILRPGAIEVAADSLGGGVTFRYTTHIEVWQHYTDDSATRTNLFERVAALALEIVKWPYLGGLAEDCSLSSGGQVQEMWKEGGNGPLYLMQELTVSWSAPVDVTFSE